MLKNKSTHFAITFVTMFAVQGALAATTAPAPKQVVADYTRPLSFEPNRGQADKRVDFLAHGTGYGLFLSHADAVMTFEHGAAVRMRPVGANATSKPEPLDAQTSKSNYFIGNVPERWHSNIGNYGKVRYNDVYPGVDLIYYGNQRQLEYDFVVSAGADASKILLDFQGATKAALDRSGDIVLHTAAGDLRWHKPIAYQEVHGDRKLIACSYVRKGQRLGFRVGAYDPARPLIIDPVLEYSTYLGGSVHDEAHAIAADSRGNAYVTGSTQSYDFPTTENAFQENEHYGFVAKFDTDGKLVYSTYLGGSGGDEGNGIAVDSHGNAYVVGTTGSTDFPIKNAFQDQNKNCAVLYVFTCSSAFVTKLDAVGSAVVYSTYLGGSGGLCGFFCNYGDSGSAIAVDAHDSAYVTGYTISTDFPVKNAFQDQPKGQVHEIAFVTKFDAAGNELVYSTYLGGSALELGNGITVDHQDHAYVTGQTYSLDFPVTQNAFQKTLPNSSGSAFVTKFETAGAALLYSTYLGGSGCGRDGDCPDQGKAIAVDSHGDAYVTGATASTDFPVKRAFQDHNNCPGCPSAFVTRLDAAGDALIYSTYLGGNSPSSSAGAGIAVDRARNAYVTGTTNSTDFPIKNAFQRHNTECFECTTAFVTKIDPMDCALVYSSYLGGSGGNLESSQGENANGIAVDALGNAYVTGVTRSSDFPTKNAFQNMPKSPYGNAFVTKVSAH
jgi:hypothetical protein